MSFGGCPQRFLFWAPADCTVPSRFQTRVDSDTAVLFGGLSPTGTLNDVWEYKVAQKKWTRLHEGGVGPLDTDPYSTVPSPRTGHAAVVLRGDLFIFGGYDPDRGDTNDVWKFTRATGVWSHVTLAAGADVPPVPPPDAASSVFSARPRSFLRRRAAEYAVRS